MSTASPADASSRPTDPAPSGSDRAPSTRRGWRIDVAVLAIVAMVLRLPAFFASRSMIFDDGVYGMSAVAMRHGELPFRDIFSSQGPLHLPLLFVADLVGLRTLNGTRILPMAAGITATIAMYAVARRVSTRPGAIVAALLLTTSGSVIAVTGPITSDGSAMAFTLLALLAALRYREAPSPGRAVVVGLLAGAGLATKVVMFPVGIPIAVLMLSRRRWREVAIGAGTAVGFLLLAALPWGLAAVWDQSIEYHRVARRSLSYGGNASKVVSTLVERDPAVLVALVVAVVLGCIIARGWPPSPEDPVGGDRMGSRFVTAMVVPWIVVQFGFLVAESGLWKAHVVHMVPPLVVLVAVFAVPLAVTKTVAVVSLVILPFQFMQVEQFLRPGGYTGHEAQIMEKLEALPPGAIVITDEPGFAWRAGRDIPVRYVDTSWQRIEEGRITADDVVNDARASDVCAVVAWGPGHFAKLPDLPERLETEGFVARRLGNDAVYYARPACRP